MMDRSVYGCEYVVCHYCFGEKQLPNEGYADCPYCDGTGYEPDWDGTGYEPDWDEEDEALEGGSKDA